MANTVIQIKRSTTTSAPTTLAIGELAYSYSSNTLYLGNTTGTGVIAIGGVSLGVSVNAYSNVVGAAANSYSTAVGVSANAFASATFGTITNTTAAFAAANQAGVVANNANTYGNATYVKKAGDTISGDLVIQGNLTTSGVVTYANTQTLLIGDALITLNNDIPVGTAPSENAGVEVKRGSSANVSLLWNEGTDTWTFTNDGTNFKLIASNTDVESANNYSGAMANAANAYANTVGTSGNAYAVVVGTSGNAYTVVVGASGNAYANVVGTAGNTYASAVGTSANAFATVVGAAANTNAANGSYISTGIVKVLFGGTGLTSFTANGILYGANTELKVTAAGTDGQVLQSDQGLPKFAMLDGGVF